MAYDKVLVLRYENAGIFPKRWKETNDMLFSFSKDDRIFIGGNRSVRQQEQWIEQNIHTIHYTFIANVIRVLCGQRPITKYRFTCVESSNIFETLAQRSFVVVENATYTDKNDNKRYIVEKMTTRKCMHDSWATCTPSWNRFKYLLPEELYKELIIVASDICGGNAEEMLFSNVAKILYESNDPRIDQLVIKARENRCEPLAKLLIGNSVHSLQQAGYRGLGLYLKTLVTKGVADVVRLDGIICIPLSNTELDAFSCGSGVATIFDGGLVRIAKIYDLEETTLEMIVSGYNKVQQ
jgi:hypothetical protein